MSATSPWPTSSWSSRAKSGSFQARSRATGSVHIDLPPGTYKVTLQKPGFGAKSVRRGGRAGTAAASVPAPVRRPARLRLAQVGQGRREVRVPGPFRRALPAFALAVRAPQGIHPQPRLVRRARPEGHDADHSGRRLHPDRRRVEQVRLRQPALAPVRRGARPVGAVLLPRPDGEGGGIRLSLDRRAGNGRRRAWPCWRRTSPGTPTTTSAAGAITSTPTGCHRPPRSTPGWSSSGTPTRRASPTIPRTMHPSRSTGPSRSTTSTRTPRSPTRSKAAPPATSRRPSGGSSAGSNASISTTTTTPRPSSTTARSTSMPTRS